MDRGVLQPRASAQFPRLRQPRSVRGSREITFPLACSACPPGVGNSTIHPQINPPANQSTRKSIHPQINPSANQSIRNSLWPALNLVGSHAEGPCRNTIWDRVLGRLREGGRGVVQNRSFRLPCHLHAVVRDVGSGWSVCQRPVSKRRPSATRHGAACLSGSARAGCAWPGSAEKRIC